MRHKVTVLGLLCFALVAFALNLFGCPAATWLLRDEQHQVTAAIELACRDGVLSVVIQRGYSHQNPPWLRDVNVWALYTRYSYFDLRQQRLRADSDPMFIMTVVNEVSLWPLVVIFGGYPAIAFVRGPLRRYRRRQMGCCCNCGYNLTGNVSGICSECGSEIASPPARPPN